MDPRAYLRLADALVQRVKAGTYLDGAGEAECRTAISRADYATFNVALELLDSLGLAVTQKGSCHTVVQYAFNNSADPALVPASQHLGTLYSERRKADYEMTDKRAEAVAQAELMVNLAKATINSLDTLRAACQSGTQDGSVIAGAILAWATVAGKGSELWQKK